MIRKRQAGSEDGSRKHPEVVRWRRHMIPSSRIGWLRAVFITSWVWLFSVFVVFANPTPFPKWTDYITTGCLVAIPAVVVVVFIFNWRKGFVFLAIALFGFALLVVVPPVPVN